MISPDRVAGGCIALYFSCTLASSAGLGGGGLNVPILLVLFGFDYKTAVILSLCTVLGNYISQMTVNWNKSHPLNNARPLIYWDVVLVFLPAQLGGGNIGVIIGQIFPETILLFVAMAVLLYACWKTLKKAIKYFKEESGSLKDLALNKVLLESRLSVVDGNDDDIDDSNVDDGSLPSSVVSPVVVNDTLKLDAYLTSSSAAPHYNPIITNASNNNNEDSRLFDFSRDSFSSAQQQTLKFNKTILQVIGAVWICYAALYVSMQLTVTVCSTPYFVLLCATYVPLVATVLWGVNYIANEQKEDSFSVLEGDIDFTQISYLAPCMAFVIGILCSLLGIGGGELMGPLLLSLKVTPQVTSATTSLMSLLSSSSNVLHYAIRGDIDWRWGITTFSVGLLGGFSGRNFALYLVKKYKRASITTFMLVIVLFISIWLLVYHILADDRDFDMHSFC